MTETINYDQYEMTIGIECHVQLATNTKLFSPADNDARLAEPNSKLHVIDYAVPGTLPRLNRQAVDLAVKAGKALNAEIANISSFDRKHYFYPDLPKGYQTTQLYRPIIGAGKVEVPLGEGKTTSVRIHHAHLEEDAGKLTHQADGSLVDLNRAGTPLIEIVSQPDIHSPVEARAFAEELHKLMTYSGVTRGDLYHGNMRFDVNLSVAKKGDKQLGKRTETKNLNSFRSVEKAAEYEFHRQVELLEAGQTITQETRGWIDDQQITVSQRSKEDAQDYRYMPDPDIPPIVLSEEEIGSIQSEVPKLPAQYRQEFSALKVDSSVIGSLLQTRQYAELVSQVLSRDISAATRLANWLASSLSGQQEEQAAEPKLASVDDLLTLADMTAKSEISSNAASNLFNQLMAGAKDPRQLASQQNLLQLSDESVIAAVVDQVLADPASKKSVDDIKAGKDKAIGYLVGQVMKLSQGKANPALAQKLIKDRI